MKCPKCGQVMEEGHLYCEKCGMEIQIVPDFEPDFENSITETLSTVAEEIEDKGKKKDASGLKQEDFFTDTASGHFLLVRVVTFVCIVVIAVVSSLLFYFNYSVTYQVKRARECAGEADYEAAVKYLDRAIELEHDNAQMVLLQANYVYLAGNVERAETLLLDLIETSHSLTAEEAEKAYDYLIALYDKQEKYQEINKLLSECQNETIVTMFQNYMAMEPEFSYVGGSYDEVIPLKLSANTTGKIYYTLDGSTPNKNSRVYTSPIFLESGTYKVSALFINEYGIESKVVQNWYEINLTVPDPPQVLLYSGKYEVPTLIEASTPLSDAQIYYTTDGSAPNENSLIYTEPVEMPLGRSNFKFIVISDAGVSSEIVSRSYEFKPDTDVTVSDASLAVVKALMARDVIKDLQGNAKAEEGKYNFQYSTIVEIEKKYYYVLDEYFTDASGNRKKTGLLYAVEIYTGSPNRLVYDEQGQMGLIPLSD